MLGRLAALAVCVSLAACANLEPAGRNANRDPAPPRPAATRPAPAPAPATAPLPVPTTSTPTPAPSAAPVITAPPPPPPVVSAPTPTPAPAPAAARPAPVEPTPAPSAAPTSGRFTPNPSEDEVVVPGQRDRQITPPSDWRSATERMEDIRAWDQCVTRVQAAYERDPMRPQLDSPEQYCARSLGMSNRDAIPISRQERRR